LLVPELGGGGVIGALEQPKLFGPGCRRLEQRVRVFGGRRPILRPADHQHFAFIAPDALDRRYALGRHAIAEIGLIAEQGFGEGSESGKAEARDPVGDCPADIGINCVQHHGLDFERGSLAQQCRRAAQRGSDDCDLPPLIA
jgi:hypothetical protein